MITYSPSKRSAEVGEPFQDLGIQLSQNIVTDAHSTPSHSPLQRLGILVAIAANVDSIVIPPNWWEKGRSQIHDTNGSVETSFEVVR